MKTLSQLGLILSVALLGEVVAGLLPVTFPGSVMGMVLLFLFLCVGVVRLEWVEVVADYFVGNMALLFVPITVGVVEIYPMLREKALGVVLMCFIVSFFTFFAAWGSVVLVTRLMGGDGGGR